VRRFARAADRAARTVQFDQIVSLAKRGGQMNYRLRARVKFYQSV
jgi:hypothetical protein